MLLIIIQHNGRYQSQYVLHTPKSSDNKEKWKNH